MNISTVVWAFVLLLVFTILCGLSTFYGLLWASARGIDIPLESLLQTYGMLAMGSCPIFLFSVENPKRRWWVRIQFLLMAVAGFAATFLGYVISVPFQHPFVPYP